MLCDALAKPPGGVGCVGAVVVRGSPGIGRYPSLDRGASRTVASDAEFDSAAAQVRESPDPKPGRVESGSTTWLCPPASHRCAEHRQADCRQG